MYHSRNCEGAGHRCCIADRTVPPWRRAVPTRSAESNAWEAFAVAHTKTRKYRCLSLIDYVEGLVEKHNLTLDVAALEYWRRGQLLCDNVVSECNGSIDIYVCKLSELADDESIPVVDVVNTFATDAFSDLYRMHSVTGADERVQAVLSTQVSAAQAFEDAIMKLELQRHLQRRAIIIACTGATHRSFGMACLVALMAYPDAHLIPSTARTIKAARALLVAVSA